VYRQKVQGQGQTAIRYVHALSFAFCPLPFACVYAQNQTAQSIKLHDSKSNFIFECIGIEQLKKKEPIKYYQVEYTKISLRDWKKLNMRYHDDFIKYQNSFGIEVVITDPNTQQEMKISSYKLPYNPIELE
jgi:hypothetical protein